MAVQTSELLEKIRQQFDNAPYPRIPIEDSPKENISLLYFHSLITPYYQRNQKVIDPKDKVILDAGCGSGFKSLTLALANPGAKVIGVDISEQSVKLAEQRLAYHGIENAEFHVCGVEDLASLGMSFDYINCDELLYLFPSPAAALKSMGSVLKPNGIIRSNLHCAFQRAYLFRAQELFKTMGLMEDNPREMEIEIATETMKALRDVVLLKARTWDSSYEDEKAEEKMLMNYLFQGDKGYTIRDMFASFRSANLEFVKMLNWHRWNLLDLFKEPDNLPAYWAMSLPEVSEEDKLYLFELLHPIHRLIDFWCGHPNEAQSFIPVSEWEDSHWEQAKVYLHPQLKTPNFREELVKSVTAMKPFAIGQFLSLNGEDLILDSSMAHCLIPLLEQPQSMTSLVQRWKQIRPLDPITLEQTEDREVFYLIRQFLSNLEDSGYILLEQQS